MVTAIPCGKSVSDEAPVAVGLLRLDLLKDDLRLAEQFGEGILCRKTFGARFGRFWCSQWWNFDCSQTDFAAVVEREGATIDHVAQRAARENFASTG